MLIESDALIIMSEIVDCFLGCDSRLLAENNWLGLSKIATISNRRAVRREFQIFSFV